MYKIFQPAIQDVLTHVILSPDIFEVILLHFCPWKHFETHLYIHSANVSYIICQIRFTFFNLECEMISNMASVFTFSTLLSMKTFYEFLLNTLIFP